MSINPTAVVEAFSITHAQVMDGSTEFATAALAAATTDEELDIYGVNNSSLEPNSDKYDNEGDDTVLSIWQWLVNADLDIQAGYLSFPLISNITQTPLESSGTGVDSMFEMDLWHEDSFNVPPLPVMLRMPSKDAKGNVRTLTLGLYRVQFAPVTFDGPAYKDGLKVNMPGTALMSNFDELGVAFADGKKRVGRIISHK